MDHFIRSFMTQEQFSVRDGGPTIQLPPTACAIGPLHLPVERLRHIRGFYSFPADRRRVKNLSQINAAKFKNVSPLGYLVQ